LVSGRPDGSLGLEFGGQYIVNSTRTEVAFYEVQMNPDRPTGDRTNEKKLADQPKTIYAELKEKLENKRWVAAILLVSAILGGATALIKNVGDISALFNKSHVEIDAATKYLADNSPEVRIIGANRIAEIGIQTQRAAQESIAVLTTFLSRESRILDKPRQSQERADVVAALKALGKILESANEKNWSVARPRLEKLDFSGLDLSGLFLRGVVIVDTSFERAVLSHADLSETEMINVRLDRAQAQAIKLTGARISSSCMEEMDLTSADLRLLESRSSDFNSAALASANLSGARLRNTSVGNADFRNCDLSSTDLSEALEIVEGQLEKAASTKKAKLPDPLYRRSNLSVCGRHG
jgi:uncharacterized protein YjbI with pentapeptide repeats